MTTIEGVLLDFTLHEQPGWVEVTIQRNQDPEALGCAPDALDFPVCTATVTYRRQGYLAALGWIQVVRSTDGASGGKRFELDPFELLGQLPHPFCWLGFTPRLFDAPRERRVTAWTGLRIVSCASSRRVSAGWRLVRSWALAGDSRSATGPCRSAHRSASRRRTGMHIGLF
jgi:hypothetical protein